MRIVFIQMFLLSLTQIALADNNGPLFGAEGIKPVRLILFEKQADITASISTEQPKAAAKFAILPKIGFNTCRADQTCVGVEK